MKVSKTGYKKDSKDKNEKSLIVPGGNITMSGVSHPVVGIDNLGNVKLMQPGVENYLYPGDYVTEYPIKQQGGTIIVNDKKDPRLLAYKDSLESYNRNGQYFSQLANILKNAKTKEEFLKKSGELQDDDRYNLYDYKTKPKNIDIKKSKILVDRTKELGDGAIVYKHEWYDKPKQPVVYKKSEDVVNLPLKIPKLITSDGNLKENFIENTPITPKEETTQIKTTPFYHIKLTKDNTGKIINEEYFDFSGKPINKMKQGGIMKEPINKGFKHLPEYVQKHILNNMKQLGGQPDYDNTYDPLSQFFQMGGQQPMTSYQWNQYNQTLGYQPIDSSGGNPYKEFYNPKDYFKDENGGFTKVSDRGKAVNYNNDPTYNPFIRYSGGKSSEYRMQPKKQAIVPDPMKQVGFNGMLSPVVEQYKKGGSMDKFVKNYVKKLGRSSEAPQGFSMDDYITNNNDQLVDYIAGNTRNAIFKEEMGMLQDNRGKFQMGGSPNSFDPNMWANQDNPNIVPPDNTPQKQQYSLYEAPTGNNYSSFTQGPFGPYAQQPLPTYLPQQPKQEINPNWQGAGVDLNPDVLDIMNTHNANKIKTAQTQSSVRQPDYGDIYLGAARGINNLLETNQNTRQMNFLNNKFAIENMSTPNYGSRGDYDINQGYFRPNETTPSFQSGGENKKYKVGGSYDLSQEEIQGLISSGYNVQFVD